MITALSHRTAIALFALLILTPAAAAQDPPVKPDADETSDTVLREQSIYIPYSKLRTVFEKEGRGVFLPYEKFEELWRAARSARPPVTESRPPVGALITEVDSEATVGEDVVRVSAKVAFEVLTEGWTEVPLRLSDAAIRSAQLNGRPARITFDGKLGYKLLVEKEGKEPQQYELSLEYAKAFSKAPGQNSVTFQAPQAPVNRWRIRIPQAGVKVNIHPLLAAAEAPAGAPESEDAEATVVLAFVGAAPEVRFDWTPKAEGATGLAALATVETQQEIAVDEGVIRTRTRLKYDISRAALEQLLIDRREARSA